MFLLPFFRKKKMKKYQIKSDAGYINDDVFDKYEDAESAAKKNAARLTEDVKIIERKLIATVKPDMVKIPVTVEMAKPE
jgi:hypothetical protein